MSGMTVAVWQKQFDGVSKALLPYVRTLDDGDRYIDLDAPTQLVKWYGDLLRIGYFHGWVR